MPPPMPLPPITQTVTRNSFKHMPKRKCLHLEQPRAGFIGRGIPSPLPSGAIKQLGRMAICQRKLTLPISSAVMIFRVSGIYRNIINLVSLFHYMFLDFPFLFSIFGFGSSCIHLRGGLRLYFSLLIGQLQGRSWSSCCIYMLISYSYCNKGLKGLFIGSSSYINSSCVLMNRI